MKARKADAAPRQSVRGEPDQRVKARHSWKSDFIGMLLILLAINAGYLMIFMSVYGIMPTAENLLRVETLSYTVFFSVILSTITAVMRSHTMYTPMRRLSEAAHQVAKGDFSVRLTPKHTGDKADYVDVMFEDFNTMAEELSSIETMKNDFIGNVSHEIKTPIAIIQNYATALTQPGMSEEERQEYASTIVGASRKLSALVTNILKLNKLENQGIVPESAPFDLGEQLAACALAFEERWEGKRIEFDADIEEGVIVCGDQQMLEIVWNNLISNAVKFTPEGGRVAVSLKREDNLAIATVSDSGCGMDEMTLRHIFDKFYQGDTSHAQEGNGLGLAMVNRVIELLDGEIRVKSVPGEGTTFTALFKTV